MRKYEKSCECHQMNCHGCDGYFHIIIDYVSDFCWICVVINN